MIKKYLVNKLTSSPILGINMSFASRHGIETLTLHESSLELSVEETQTANLSEENKHYTLDKLNILTQNKYEKIKNALNPHTGFMPNKGISTKTIIDQIPSKTPISNGIIFKSMSSQNDDMSKSTQNIATLSHFDEAIIIHPYLFQLNLNAELNHVTRNLEYNEWNDFSNSTQNQSGWKYAKSLDFITSTKKIVNSNFKNCQKTNDINSSYATKHNQYRLNDGKNVFQRIDPLTDFAANSTTPSCIEVGTSFTDNILVYDEASVKSHHTCFKNDTSLKAGILKGTHHNRFIREEENLNSIKSRGQTSEHRNNENFLNLSNNRIFILNMQMFKHTSINKKHDKIKLELNNDKCTFKQIVNSSPTKYPLYKCLLKDIRGKEFAWTFNGFSNDERSSSSEFIMAEFINSINNDNKNNLQRFFINSTNMIKHEGSHAPSLWDANLSNGNNSVGTVNDNHSIFLKDQFVGSEEHIGDTC